MQRVFSMLGAARNPPYLSGAQAVVTSTEIPKSNFVRLKKNIKKAEKIRKWCTHFRSLERARAHQYGTIKHFGSVHLAN